MLHWQDDNTKMHRHLFPTGDGLLHRHQPSLFLPNELIFQIFLCLPVRSLMLCKCVCKLWKTLISDPQFAKTHLQNLTLNPRITHQQLLFYDHNYINRQLKIETFPMMALFKRQPLIAKAVEFSMEHEFRILGSCNGLLCMFDLDQGHVKLWNPSIRFESKKSPKLDCYHKCDDVAYCGFGYDHVNDKYKVLVVVARVDFMEDVTRIYTFGRNSWKTIKDFPCSPTESEGIFVSGTLNWLVRGGVSPKKHVIISFDLEKETYNELLLPNNDGVKIYIPVLGVLSNCLCVFFDSNKTHWDIWLMKKYGVAESWTRLTTIPIDQLTLRTHHTPWYTEPLFIFENSVVLRTYTKFVLYNLDNGSLDDCLRGINIYSKKHIYCESLVSPQL